MKKTIIIIGLCCLAVIIAIGIYMALPPKTIDFRGTATKIETVDNNTVFEIAMHDVIYTVTANEKTKVAYCHEDDPAIELSDIKVGDTIEGRYRKFSKDKLAKYITVWMGYENKLTLNRVIELSAKGNELTWSDFAQYESIETGSGLYILVYDIDDTFQLIIGGGNTEEAPMYIRLVLKEDWDIYADVRTDDVHNFIETNGKKLIAGNMKTYYKMSDGTWQYDGHIYKYRLEITGRQPYAVKDSTYVYLSNIAEISFQKAMMASGLSSNTEDYFDIEEAVLVEIE